MINNNNIEELVQQKLQHFESEVSANVWDKIDGNLNQLQPNVDPGSVADALVKSAGTNVSAWIGGISVAIIGVISVGFFFLNSANNSEALTNIENTSPTDELVESAPENRIAAEPIINNSGETKPIDNSSINKKSIPVISTTVDDNKLPEAENTINNDNSNSDISTNNESELVSNQVVQNAVPLEDNAENNFTPVIETQSEAPVEVTSTKNKYSEIVAVDEIIEKVEEQEYTNVQISSLGQIPNVFTPNGDGINDHFLFPVNNIAEIQVNIFDAKGDLVLQMGGTKKIYWDGNLRNGQAAAIGNYFYAVYATGFDKQKLQRKGSLYLNR